MASKAPTGKLAIDSEAQPSEDLYREIFKYSSEPIAIINPAGFYIENNAAHELMLGYSQAELQNRTPAIHLGEECFDNIASQLAETGEYRGEAVSRTKSGETKYVVLSFFAMRNPSGEPTCYVGIVHDITARRQAEEALERNEAQLTDFFENSAVAMHWVGPDGIIIRVNQAELDLLGYTREEYEGHHIAEFHVDKPVIEDILKRLKNGEVVQNYEVRLRCKDGDTKYARINSSVYREGERFVHTRSFTHDITERRRTENRLALQYAVTQILAESTDYTDGARKIVHEICERLDWEVAALWQTDTERNQIRNLEICHAGRMETPEFDRSTKNLTLTKGVGLPGRIWDSGKPVWIENIVEDHNFKRARAAEKEGLHGAFGFPVTLGSEVLGVIEFFSADLRKPDEEFLKMVAGIGGQLGQFTERQRAQKESEELFKRETTARAEAEKANRLKDEFLATLSHELRTPLNAVIGWSRMLGSGRLDRESSKHALEVIERNAWAQKQIIEDILDVSRVITGKLQLNLGPVDLVAVVDAALDAVRPALEAKEIKIETTIDASLRVVSGDPDRLQQVVWNVLSNAAKFTPAGGQVEIAVGRSGNQVEIQVKDTGPGIDPAFLPHVFERFRQADGSTTRTHGGLGLGLAIVRHLVELHGGRIAVENREDRSGAVFTVSLPLPSGELRHEALVAAASIFRDAQSEPPSLEGVKLLLVDDESDTLDLISVELAQYGATVTAVGSAEDALKALETSEFDLMISDIGMPVTDGYDLIKKIRKLQGNKNQFIPAVALTAYARVQDRMRAILAGYSTHIAKPVEANELVTVVAGLAGRLGKI